MFQSHSIESTLYPQRNSYVRQWGTSCFTLIGQLKLRCSSTMMHVYEATGLDEEVQLKNKSVFYLIETAILNDNADELKSLLEKLRNCTDQCELYYLELLRIAIAFNKTECIMPLLITYLSKNMTHMNDMKSLNALLTLIKTDFQNLVLFGINVPVTELVYFKVKDCINSLTTFKTNIRILRKYCNCVSTDSNVCALQRFCFYRHAAVIDYVCDNPELLLPMNILEKTCMYYTTNWHYESRCFFENATWFNRMIVNLLQKEAYTTLDKMFEKTTCWIRTLFQTHLKMLDGKHYFCFSKEDRKILRLQSFVSDFNFEKLSQQFCDDTNVTNKLDESPKVADDEKSEEPLTGKRRRKKNNNKNVSEPIIESLKSVNDEAFVKFSAKLDVEQDLSIAIKTCVQNEASVLGNISKICMDPYVKDSETYSDVNSLLETYMYTLDFLPNNFTETTQLLFNIFGHSTKKIKFTNDCKFKEFQLNWIQKNIAPDTNNKNTTQFYMTLF